MIVTYTNEQEQNGSLESSRLGGRKQPVIIKICNYLKFSGDFVLYTLKVFSFQCKILPLQSDIY